MDSHGIVSKRSQGLIDAAYEFAKEAHGEQKRKYTGEPYINHPVAVAQLVASVTEDCEMIAAALLHDVIEDTAVTYKDLVDTKNGFGPHVANLVWWLSDVSRLEDGNRKIRKHLDRLHISGAPSNAKTIKLADLCDNTSSITKYDPGFAKIYMEEKKALLPLLATGNPVLLLQARTLCNDYFRSNT